MRHITSHMNASNTKSGRRTAAAQVMATLGCFLLTLAAPTAALAQPLSELVLQSLERDPSLAEAQANRAGARAKAEGSRALHLPRFGVTSAQGLSGQNTQRTKPELTGSFNLWAGGSIEAQAKADAREEHYFTAKLAETRNDLALKIATLYLEALRQRESIAVAEVNLARHEKILTDLTTIAKYDQGRQADVLQAQARMAQVKARILGLHSELKTSMSRLSKYSGQADTQVHPVEIDAHNLAQRLAEPGFESNALYTAQVQEVARVAHLVDVAKGQRQPRIELEARGGERLVTQLRLNWDFYDQTGGASVRAARQRVTAAQAKLDGLVQDLTERRRTAAVDLEQARLRLQATQGQIASARRVAEAYEKQFQIARRTLVDLLNAYGELATVETGLAQAQQELRLAALRALYANDGLEDFLRAAPSAPAAAQESTTPAAVQDEAADAVSSAVSSAVSTTVSTAVATPVH
jgi:outer membrane protein, adhesin transport system